MLLAVLEVFSTKLFTGIIQTMGNIQSARRSADGTVFTVQAAGFVDSIRPGDSVAVNGVCLTAERCEADGFTHPLAAVYRASVLVLKFVMSTIPIMVGFALEA